MQAVERARHDLGPDRRNRAELNEFSIRPGDVDVFELVRIQAVDPLDLRDHFVGAAGDVEAVDEISAEHGGDVRADLREIQAERRGLVVIDHDLGLRLVDFRIDDRREEKLAAFHRGGP